ncbi:MarR family winged helix-turn-helix transcriptional regulator [Roseivivax sediminis]|uniref:DNA-binding transcriptional regulator, MarR family n=1 Tax=Roseivivax sediminis TaxID=936889 RepID=A0A1I2A2C3_9RHOB|nr:MarR family transcriptional regulator [Roseivivax sediminis]SFE38132.1 DNA-binding transcriptional regulator, MarR family [Roseivivax sediminis]
MADTQDLTITLVSEILAADQLLKSRLARVLPARMELSHFSALNLLARSGGERTPAQMARMLHLTRGAMTNTLTRLDTAGYVHIRPDWDDARSKLVAISPAGRRARDEALAAIAPVLTEATAALDDTRLRAALPALRALRQALEAQPEA